MKSCTARKCALNTDDIEKFFKQLKSFKNLPLSMNCTCVTSETAVLGFFLTSHIRHKLLTLLYAFSSSYYNNQQNINRILVHKKETQKKKKKKEINLEYLQNLRGNDHLTYLFCTKEQHVLTEMSKTWQIFGVFHKTWMEKNIFSISILS